MISAGIRFAAEHVAVGTVTGFRGGFETESPGQTRRGNIPSFDEGLDLDAGSVLSTPSKDRGTGLLCVADAPKLGMEVVCELRDRREGVQANRANTPVVLRGEASRQ